MRPIVLVLQGKRYTLYPLPPAWQANRDLLAMTLLIDGAAATVTAKWVVLPGLLWGTVLLMWGMMSALVLRIFAAPPRRKQHAIVTAVVVALGLIAAQVVLSAVVVQSPAFAVVGVMGFVLTTMILLFPFWCNAPQAIFFFVALAFACLYTASCPWWLIAAWMVVLARVSFPLALAWPIKRRGIAFLTQPMLLPLIVRLLCLIALADILPAPGSLLPAPVSQFVATTKQMIVHDLHIPRVGIIGGSPPLSAPVPLDGIPLAGNAGPLYVFTSSLQPAYLPIHALSDYHDDAWWPDDTQSLTLAPGQPLTSPADTASLQTVQTTVHVLQGGAAIVAPGRFISASLPVKVGYHDAGAYESWQATNALSAGTTYQTVSQETVVSPAALARQPSPQTDPAAYPSRLLQENTHLPDTLRDHPDNLVKTTAQQWTAGAATEAAQLQALVTHFQSKDFTYSLINPVAPASVDAAEWLLKTRSGYCEWFATSFAMMARSLGYPTRVMQGFVPGSYDTQTNTWSVSGLDAHLWPQVWFPGGIGWVDFEPTNGFGDPDPLVTIPAAASGTVAVTPLPPLTPLGSPPAASSDAGFSGSLVLRWTLLALIAAACGGVGVLWFARPRQPKREGTRQALRSERFYARLVLLVRLAGIQVTSPAETATEFSERLAARFPGAAASIHTLTTAYLDERFGDQTPSHAALQDAWKVVRRQIAATMFRRQSPPA